MCGARPAKDAVVVLQDVFGVNVLGRAVTDSLAAQGYLALQRLGSCAGVGLHSEVFKEIPAVAIVE